MKGTRDTLPYGECSIPRQRNKYENQWQQDSAHDGNAAKVILKRFYDPDMNPWMNKLQIKRILDRRNAEITGATLGAGCEVSELVQSFATVNGQTPTVVPKAESEQ